MGHSQMERLRQCPALEVVAICVTVALAVGV